MGYTNLLLELEGPKQSLRLDIACHVNKYLENIVYSSKILEGACILNYFENEKINALKNLSIRDTSFSLKENIKKKEEHLFYEKIEATKYHSPYSSVLITNKTTIDKDGEIIPLFFKHKLPAGTKEATIEISTNSEEKVSGSYIISIEDGCIYTNYRNRLDRNTGEYSIIYIHSSGDEANSGERNILNLVPAIGELSWEDIDPETGRIKQGISVYSKEQTSSGYVYELSNSGPWYCKPYKDSSISLVEPSAIDVKDGWNIRITNGDIKAVTNAGIKRYWVPEYLKQIFAPYAPYTFVPYEKIEYVNSKTLKTARNDLAVEPEKLLHLEITIEDEEGNPMRILTSDFYKDGERFRDTNVYYEFGVINGWDNSSGFISFNQDISGGYNYFAKYFFKNNYFELKELNLNPLYRKNEIDWTWSVYCIPDVRYDERAIQWVGVDGDGIIRFSSQVESRSYPNLSQRDQAGNKNPLSIIGKKYRGIKGDSFLEEYSSEFENEHQYLILGEMNVLDVELVENSDIFDLKYESNFIKEERRQAVFERNSRLLNSKYGYGYKGIEYSKRNSLVCKVPLKILKKYGGDLEEKQALNFIEKSLPASKKVIFEWEHPKPNIHIRSTETDTVSIKVEWLGPNYKYNIYRKDRPEGARSKIAVLESAAEIEDFLFEDSGLQSGEYYYRFSVTENGIEYPESETYIVRVK